jgi:hypothetical protein
MRICVYGCIGRDGHSEPYLFYLGARRLPVIAILRSWEEPGQRYFEVQADDDRRFLLRHLPDCDRWELAAVYRGPRRLRVHAVGSE